VSGALADKVILCTGGGLRNRASVVQAYLREGALVGVLERDPSKVTATSAEDTNCLTDAMLRRWGRLDAATTFVGIFDL
jgi:hypothetical protein